METEVKERPVATQADSESWEHLDPSESDQVLDIGLSESQLREAYDNEEVERFMSLFAANVTEFHIPTPKARAGRSSRPDVSFEIGRTPRSLSEKIAGRYLLPYLPPPPPPPAEFTLGRLRIATQRLYLSTVPVYIPFLNRMLKLSIWEDKYTSGCYCLLYWALWYHDLLLPGLLFRILYCLIRRRIFPYPTGAELRERQIEIERAKELGDEVSAHLASSSSFDIPEMWRLFRLLTKSAHSNARKDEKITPKDRSRKEKGKGKEAIALDDRSDDIAGVSTFPESQQEKDLKRSALQCADTIADFHERIHNLFIWRRPKISFRYGMFITLCLVLTLLLPARYIAKIVYLVSGIIFWHVAPVIATLPLEDRARLSPLLCDVQTDADYAMELISQRINAGLDVRPPRKKHRKMAKVKDEPGTDVISPTNPLESIGTSDANKNVNWKKWGERAAIGKTWAIDKRLVGGNREWPQISNIPETPLVPPAAIAIGRPHSPVESHNFPCQHVNGPGLVILSPAMFYFTPLMAVHPTVEFPLKFLKGVKKSGLLKGLTLTWTNTNDEDHDHEEIFKWIGGRDELFARLIGSDVSRWKRA